MIPIAGFFDKLIKRLQKTGLAGQHPLVIGLLLSALAITLAAPDYRRFYPYPGVPWAQAAVNWQFSHPLEPIPVAEFAKSATPSESGIVEHLEKKSYRVAVPLASNLLRIGVQGALISQQIASYLLL